MFNGYHETPATSYNDLEPDRGKKTQNTAKWHCGIGTGVQPSHLHPQNHQPEIWSAKAPILGIPPNSAQKCSCPTCYQIPDNQSFQGDITWPRAWISRTFPVPLNASSHEHVSKSQTSHHHHHHHHHHWEGVANESNPYGESVVGTQYAPNNGEKSMFCKSYANPRHEDLYQTGILAKNCKINRKDDLTKDDGEIPTAHLGPNAIRYQSTMPNPAWVDRRTVEERGYCNQNEKYPESCRQQNNLTSYHLHPRHTMLEPFLKTVPSNSNQNRVPSVVGHRNVKEFPPYVEDVDVGKASSHAIAEEKQCRSLYPNDITKDLNSGQEGSTAHPSLINSYSSPSIEYHNLHVNRDLGNQFPAEKELQKFVNGRTPQYFPLNNFPDGMRRNGQNFVLDSRRNAVDALRPPQTKDVDVHAAIKSSCYGKYNQRDFTDKIPDATLMVGNVKEPELDTSRPQIQPADRFVSHKGYNCPQGLNPLTAYKAYRRPEYIYPRRNVQGLYEHPNGITNKARTGVQVPVNQDGIIPYQHPEFRNGFDTYSRLNSNYGYEIHQPEKIHYQRSEKPQTAAQSVFLGPNYTTGSEDVRQTEKENHSVSKASHLESIRQEDLCKNGTTKISPLRLLRKKKFVSQKKEPSEGAVPSDATPVKASTPPLDVRRFWATWAEEEEENLPQPQMVVLDCHNIDPEQAGLLHLYNSEPIRTVHLEDTGGLKTIEKNSIVMPEAEKPLEIRGDEKHQERLEKLIENMGKMDGKEPHGGVGLELPVILEATKGSVKDSAVKVENFVQSENGELNCRGTEKTVAKSEEKDFKKAEEDSVRVDLSAGNENEVSDLLGIFRKDDWVAPLVSSSEAEKTPTEMKQETEPVQFNEEGRNLSPCSVSSEDSETGDMPALSDLPTSEYRKNKFLDYSEASVFSCNSFSVNAECRSDVASSSSIVINKEHAVARDDSQPKRTEPTVTGTIDDLVREEDSEKVPTGEEDETKSKAPDKRHGNPEMDEILQKFSDINFQGSIGVSDSLPEQYKTDKKNSKHKKDRRTSKKLSHRDKSSRTDQLTLQNISLTKPTIKFSIQKSHDLKISLKVLNNAKKYEKSNSEDDDDEDEIYGETRGNSVGSSDGGDDGQKKNSRRLITLSLESLPEDDGRKNKTDEELLRTGGKHRKKKKDASNDVPLRTPVLKIKKSRFLGSIDDEGKPSSNADMKSTGAEVASSDDFQVHESVDAAKIKLTFKRHKSHSEKRSSEGEGNADSTVEESFSTLERHPSDLDCADSEGYNSNDETQPCDSRLSDAEFDMKLQEKQVDPLKQDEETFGLSESPLRNDVENFKCALLEDDAKSTTGQESTLNHTDFVPAGTRSDEEPLKHETVEMEELPVSETEELPGEPISNTTCESGKEHLLDSEIIGTNSTDKSYAGEEEALSTIDVNPSISSCEIGISQCKEEKLDAEIEQNSTVLAEIKYLEESDGEIEEPDPGKETKIPEECSNLNISENKPESEMEEKRNAIDIKVESSGTFEEKDVGESRTLESLELKAGDLEGFDDMDIEEMDEIGEIKEVTAEEFVEAVVEDKGCAVESSAEEINVPGVNEGNVSKEPDSSESLVTTTGCNNRVEQEELVELLEEPPCEEMKKCKLILKDCNVKSKRRYSYEALDCVAEPETRSRTRCNSLTLELSSGAVTIENTVEVADQIDVCDIPLPAGNAPVENCFDIVGYIKKANSLDKGTNTDFDEPELSVTKICVEPPKSENEIEEEKPTPQTVITLSEEVPPEEPASIEERVKTDSPDKDLETLDIPVLNPIVSPLTDRWHDPTPDKNASTVEEVPKDEVDTKVKEADPMDIDISGLTFAEDKLDVNCYEYSKDLEISLEYSLKTNQLYECQNLTFDEPLTITDDMEEEKVSDDDKFRDMMQNCLENAKKFLNVDNLKLFSCSVDDFLEIDCKNTKTCCGEENSENHVSRDVLLTTSCEESGSDELVVTEEQQQPISIDYVPSFCSDEGSNLCSEILPVDNWPYLEEEVPSSPVIGKSEESDLLNSSLENFNEENISEKNPTEDFTTDLNHDTKNKIPEVMSKSKLQRQKVDTADEGGRDELKDDQNGNSLLNEGLNRKRSSSYCGGREERMVASENFSDTDRKRMRSTDYESQVCQSKMVLFQSSKDKTAVIQKVADEVAAMKRYPDGEGNRTRKRKRFRNLHSKRRVVPDEVTLIKENESAAQNSSSYRGNLVYSEGDSDLPESNRVNRVAERFRGRERQSDRGYSGRREDSRKDRKRNDYDYQREKEKNRWRERSMYREKYEDCHRDRSRDSSGRSGDRERSSRSRVERVWVCEVCGFTKVAERATHIQSHPFHCQSCHLAFKAETNFVEHLTRKHKDIRNQHHCLLCELSFDFERDYYRHLETREHTHLEAVEKNTINTLFKLLTGHPCPVLGPVESRSEWLPSQAGTVHFYHQATPLSLALQYLKLNHEKTYPNAGPPPRSE